MDLGSGFIFYVKRPTLASQFQFFFYSRLSITRLKLINFIFQISLFKLFFVGYRSMLRTELPFQALSIIRGIEPFFVKRSYV